MRLRSLGLAVLFLLTCVFTVHASDRPNNKFGIHVASPHDEDLKRAADLVNSNGGKWGYLTVVIQENDRDSSKWQEIFDKLREYHLIPIIRLATQPENGNWKRPKKSDADSWVQFLNKLNWVTKDRYIILFNEANHATEWGGAVDAVNFAEVNKEFAEKLKKSNSDYFVMMGGLDASAPSSLPNYQDESIFLRQVVNAIGVSDFNRLFDGLSSHSYPNPGFVGSSNGFGKGSVRTYEWELEFLTSLGVHDLPVFITETGWNGDAISRDQVAANYQTAYENVWLPDSRVWAVTPFLLNYQTEPFLQFSWVKPGNTGVFPEYTTVQSLGKTEGKPQIRERGVFYIDFPKEITAESTYHLQFELENRGQAYWNDDEYSLKLEGLDETRYLLSSVGKVRPFDKRVFDVYVTTGELIGKQKAQFVLYKGNDEVLRSSSWEFEIVPLPSLNIKASLFPKFSTTGKDFELQVYDEYEQMVFKKTGITITKGKGNLERVENIAFNRKYRVVLLKKNYLPRQTYFRFKRGENDITFEPMVPFDFNGDGAGKWDDIPSFFMHLPLVGNLLPF